MQEQNNEALALIAEMREEMVALKARIATLEHQVAQSAAASAPVTEEDMLAISAAVAAFLGVRARIRQVRLVHSSAWAQVGRMGTHASHRTH
jgi:methylmalonyl-CoA carboxyltransferase large subunit